MQSAAWRTAQGTYFSPETNSCEAYQELSTINGINDIPTRLRSLMDWLDTFSDDTNVTGEGEELLLAMLREKQGVCRHKSMIFQMFCHYWGIPARQVWNTSHSFVEISPDGGHTWRQYQLGGGGQASSDTTEPDWGDYRQLGNSVLRSPIERSARVHSEPGFDSLDQQYQGIKEKLAILNEKLKKKVEVSKDDLQELKNDYFSFLNMPEKDLSRFYRLPINWALLISPQLFSLYGEDINRWKKIIEKSARLSENSTNQRSQRSIFVHSHVDELLTILSEKDIDTPYLIWLCDIYDLSPWYIKHSLLAILKFYSKRRNSYQLKNRMELMFNSIPLSMTNLNLNNTPLKCYKKMSTVFTENAQIIPKSKSLMLRITETIIHQKLNHQPVENSKILPENLVTGEPAFLSKSKSISYRPIIFDCSILIEEDAFNKIDKINKFDIKPEIKELLLVEEPFYGFNTDMNVNILSLFFQWLTIHHMSDLREPIWLTYQYEHWSETKKITDTYQLALKAEHLRLNTDYPLELPPSRISDYFNQPSALVLQSKDIFFLLDEFLALIVN
ncbi:transglutaminase-like domain-containing protein [Endozoicomonas sp. SCSIO W0465]|uniref:transglutaminase-like domain-containing protein n=1 Tax=Endozoicomonas sp. SCSIO W0465 TaxID=2918516 RepID=UPI002076301D|nr:transglutaminase-like domain-containing protein [Endozoicomonas sp. SCSIO W0465]USE35132.1 transglutaminase-like domain-containing protein [Endozoicomonas sp. SCSIO W0465]